MYSTENAISLSNMPTNRISSGFGGMASMATTDTEQMQQSFQTCFAHAQISKDYSERNTSGSHKKKEGIVPLKRAAFTAQKKANTMMIKIVVRFRKIALSFEIGFRF